MSRAGALRARSASIAWLRAMETSQPERAAPAGLEAAGAVPDLDEGLLHGFLGVAAVA